jgi:restriction system protein
LVSRRKEDASFCLAAKHSPEERIDSAISELNDSLSEELLGIVLNSPPEFFERLVLDVLHAMGYGVSRADLDPTGGSGDGGIDGIITLDKLGLEKIYVQAKRWSTGTVSRPDIQGFFGALAGKRATKGVFITTSAFSAGARDYAAQVSDSLVLVDGQQLTELMMEYGVGVTIQRTVKIGRVDSDYFEV